jgi:hypothetical protein
MAAKTISSPKGAGDIRHNNRDFFTPNVDPERTDLNRVYIKQNIIDAYSELFDAAVVEYNERVREKHPEQIIDDYFDKISRDRSGKKTFYETIFQIGDMKDTNVRDPAASASAIAALDEYARTFQERNPNLRVFNMVMHLDEQTPHLHIDYIPVAHGLKRGMSTQNALAQALRQQGFIVPGATKKDNETMAWQTHEREHLTGIAEKHGIEIAVLGEKRDNLNLPAFKRQAQEIDRLHAEAERDKQAAADALAKAELEVVALVGAAEKRVEELFSERAMEESKLSELKDARHRAEKTIRESFKALTERDETIAVRDEAARKVAESRQTLETLLGGIEVLKEEKNRVEREITANKKLLLSGSELKGVEIVEVKPKFGGKPSHFYPAIRKKSGAIVPMDREQLLAELKAAALYKRDFPALLHFKERFERLVDRLKKYILPFLPDTDKLKKKFEDILGDKDSEKEGVFKRLKEMREQEKSTPQQSQKKTPERDAR